MIFEHGIVICSAADVFAGDELDSLYENGVDTSVFGVVGVGRVLTRYFERSLYSRDRRISEHLYLGDVEAGGIILIADTLTLVSACETRNKVMSRKKHLSLPSFNGDIDFVTESGALYIVGFTETNTIYDMAFMQKHGILRRGQCVSLKQRLRWSLRRSISTTRK